MNLLLKLDTIQGLHPRIRDVRKSVARELVSLQEKIDYLSQGKNETSIEQPSTAKSREDLEIRDNLCIQEGQEREKLGQESIRSETHCANEFYPGEPTKGEPCLIVDSKSFEISEVERDKEDTGENLQKPVAAPLRDGVTDTESEKNMIRTQIGEEMINRSFSVDEVSHLRELENLPKGVLDEDSLEANNLVQNEQVEDKGPRDEVLTDSDSGMNDLEEMPHGVQGDDGSQESNNHMHVGKEEDEVLEHEVTVDVNTEVPKGEILYVNQVKQSDEMTLVVPVNLEVNDSLGREENEVNNGELLGKVDVGSCDIQAQTPEEETSFITKVVDASEMDGKDGLVMDAEVLSSTRNESDKCSAHMQTSVITSLFEPTEDSKACEEVAREFPSMGDEYISKWENEVIDANNPTRCGDSLTAIQGWDLPTESTKSHDVENEQNLLNEKLQVQASEVATGDPCDPADSEDATTDHLQLVSLESKQAEAEELSSSSTITSQISCESDAFTMSDGKPIEENEKLREMMQKLIEAGKEQLTAISNLSGRVKDLEKRLSRKKKLKMRRTGTSRSTLGSSCLKLSNDPLKERAVPLAI